MERYNRYQLAVEDSEDEPAIDFIFDGTVRTTIARPFSERARIVSLQDLVDDVVAGQTPPEVLEATLHSLQTNVEDAVRWCAAVASRYPQQAEFFDTNRVAYLHAREGVARMRLACREGRYRDWLPQGMAALESAVVDIDALVALEADGDE